MNPEIFRVRETKMIMMKISYLFDQRKKLCFTSMKSYWLFSSTVIRARSSLFEQVDNSHICFKIINKYNLLKTNIRIT